MLCIHRQKDNFHVHVLYLAAVSGRLTSEGNEGAEDGVEVVGQHLRERKELRDGINMVQIDGQNTSPITHLRSKIQHGSTHGVQRGTANREKLF